MGWYGENNIKCPNCGEENAVDCYRNSMLSDYFLICPDCGLCLYCEEKQWIVSRSYQNSKMIGVPPEELHPEAMVLNMNNHVLLDGMPIYFKQETKNITKFLIAGGAILAIAIMLFGIYAT